jgi:hypothetical protein
LNAGLVFAIHKLSSSSSFEIKDDRLNMDGLVAVQTRVDSPCLIKLAQENLPDHGSYFGSKSKVILPRSAYTNAFIDLSDCDKLQVIWRAEDLLNIIAREFELISDNVNLHLHMTDYPFLLNLFCKLITPVFLPFHDYSSLFLVAHSHERDERRGTCLSYA